MALSIEFVQPQDGDTDVGSPNGTVIVQVKVTPAAAVADCVFSASAVLLDLKATAPDKVIEVILPDSEGPGTFHAVSYWFKFKGLHSPFPACFIVTAMNKKTGEITADSCRVLLNATQWQTASKMQKRTIALRSLPYVDVPRADTATLGNDFIVSIIWDDDDVTPISGQVTIGDPAVVIDPIDQATPPGDGYHTDLEFDLSAYPADTPFQLKVWVDPAYPVTQDNTIGA